MVFFRRENFSSERGGIEISPEEGVGNAWKKVFEDYRRTQNDLPGLKTQEDFDRFMTVRPDFKKVMTMMVGEQKLAWGDVYKKGADVLEQMRNELPQPREEN